MSLSDTTTKVVYKPDGIETRFDITFPLFDAKDVECISVDAVGIETRITAFEVVDMESESGPAVVFDAPPQAGSLLVVRRNTRPVFLTTYPEGGKFPSKVVDQDFSRLTAMIQEILEQLSRALKVNAGERNPLENVQELYARLQTMVDLAIAAALRADQVLNLSTAAYAVEPDARPSAVYNAETGMLLIGVPMGVPGRAGDVGRDGIDGRDGGQGPPGVAPRIDAINCGHAAETQITVISGGHAGE